MFISLILVLLLHTFLSAKGAKFFVVTSVFRLRYYNFRPYNHALVCPLMVMGVSFFYFDYLQKNPCKSNFKIFVVFHYVAAGGFSLALATPLHTTKIYSSQKRHGIGRYKLEAKRNPIM